jgi:signal peptidase I
VLETIVFVVVLVVLLKSFAAEAFVIPTGSMATTLLGVNRNITCPMCGVTFPLNCHDEVEKKRGGPVRIEECICFNCRYGINFDKEREASGGSWREGSLSYGDRVLVAKFLGDLGMSPYKPLDVVVFKFPEEPLEDYTPKNYIKREIGTPDQVVGLLGGDIYTATRQELAVKGVPFQPQEWLQKIERFLADINEPVLPDEEKEDWPDDVKKAYKKMKAYRSLLMEDKLSPSLQKRFESILSRDTREQYQNDLQDKKYPLPLRRRMLKNHPDIKELLEKRDPVFHILRKPPDKIMALLRLVYDNDHPARDLLKLKYAQRWAAEADEGGAAGDPNDPEYVRRRKLAEQDPESWKADGEGKVFSIDRKNRTMAWLRYRHVLRHPPNLQNEGMGKPEPITDFLSYNTANYSRNERLYRWVGDLMLDCDVKIEKPEGELVLELSKGKDRFRARFELASGTCSLTRGDTTLAQTQTRVKAAGTYHLRFANFDQRLTLWVDKTLPFEDGGVSYTPSSLQGPTQANDLEPASIGVRGAAALSIHHLQLGRDTYYTLYPEEGLRDDEWSDPSKWKDRPLEGMTMYVQPGHYLCMGDNSPASSDSRSWDKESLNTGIGGLVPEQLMLGRALAIYWPISRFGRIK